jgi:hypothetical protein
VHNSHQKRRGSKPLQVMTHPPLSTGESTLRMIPPRGSGVQRVKGKWREEWGGNRVEGGRERLGVEGGKG